jgi:hypothetical protein
VTRRFFKTRMMAAVSSARYYWELDLSLDNPADVSVPAAISVFPGETF